ncbi:DUF4349 domain-containing protein [Streptomyces sp. NPDC055078]
MLILIGSLALAGCSGGDSGDSDTKSAGRAAAQEADPGERADTGEKAVGPGAGSPDSGGAKEGAQDAAEKPAPLAAAHIIRTAELEVRVKDATKALAVARRVASAAGGHVADESTERVEGSQMASTVVLRVPQERYDTVLAELTGTGKLLFRKADAKDVTDQVVDVQSRIATQRASVARVRALMDRAERLADVVTLEGELSRRQSELESLLSRQASLKDQTTMATITLTLSESGSAPKERKDDDPGFLDALGGGWDALGTTVRWIGVVVGATAPFLAVLVIGYAVWRLVVRPRLTRRSGAVDGATGETGGAAQETGAGGAPAPLPAYGSGSGPDQE